MQVLLHHGGIHAQDTTGHGVARVFDLDRGTLKNHLRDFLLELLSPEMRVFQLNLVDDVDAKIQVHRLVAQNVLELLCHAGHLVTATHRQNLGKAAVEEDAFCYTVKSDQVTEQLLIRLGRTGREVGVGQLVCVAD